MISLKAFTELVPQVLGRTLNDAQRECVCDNSCDNLLIVAGPGSGKTTVLVLRALRHVFVDGQLPEQIVVTTFTSKASKELRTRWLDWGGLLLGHLLSSRRKASKLNRIDLNRCRIDTLDSIAQQALSENRLPGQIAPEVIEDATANLILKRRAFSDVYSRSQTQIDDLLLRYTFDGKAPSNRGDALKVVRNLCDRILHDRVDVEKYAKGGKAQRVIVEIAQAYWKHLSESGLLDFATLEESFLKRLRDKSLKEWTQEITTILIDEYQDTNPLQEQIYFELISGGIGRATIVGDDDQAMYRFRGGSVELFTQFDARCHNVTGRKTKRVDMITNYRSSEEIVSFYNNHIRADAQFATARMVPSKPEVISARGPANFPILGMFRESASELATALAQWLDELARKRDFTFSFGDRTHQLTLTDENALGDCVLLSHTVDEAKFVGFGKNVSEKTFSGLLRGAMLARGHSIFNPRGQSLRTIQNVQRLLGLILLTLDPDAILTSGEKGFHITNEARFYLDQWRVAGQAVLNLNPKSRSKSHLRDFVVAWQRASRGNPVFNEPEWPVLELIFKLVAWIPEFQTDPEHQVWLEAITRSVTSAAVESPYQMQIHQKSGHLERSRQSIFRDGLLQIAEDELAVDEDILPSVPRKYLQLMTIHQSKGLEFPLVIVDIASAFTSNHAKQAFRRFPNNPSNSTLLEDDMEPYLVSPLREGRTSLDRTFDDLVRLYYVSYSRPQSVLLLIGCEQCLKYGTGKKLTGAIPHIGMGWLRDRTWPWRQAVSPGSRTPVMVDLPFARI